MKLPWHIYTASWIAAAVLAYYGVTSYQAASHLDWSTHDASYCLTTDDAYLYFFYAFITMVVAALLSFPRWRNRDRALVISGYYLAVFATYGASIVGFAALWVGAGILQHAKILRRPNADA